MRTNPPQRGLRGFLVALATLWLVSSFAPPAAQAQAAGQDEVSDLKRQIDEMRQAYEQRISDLERRLAQMEATQQTGTPQTSPSTTAPPAASPPPSSENAEDAEAAALRAAAQEAAGQTPTPAAPSSASAESAPEETAPADVRDVSVGSERNLNRLNPEISMTGDLVGVATNRDREDFDAREFELNVQSALDPYSFTKWTLSFSPDEGVDIEEGYVGYTGLPGGLQLAAGKFRQSFGALNRWHLHALPQLDYPLAIQSYFGEEGLAQTGVSATWLLPHPWATANEVTLELTDGESEAFGGGNFKRLVGLGHLKNYWDVNDATYAELGFSGVDGGNGTGGTSRVLGTDFTLHWQPPQRAKYREVTWRTELLRSDRDDDRGFRNEAWGGYTYVESLLAQNLYGGLRYDRVEDPLAADHRRWGLFPNLTWWQSEFVRLRGEFGYIKDDFDGNAERRFTLQIVWAAGPHKHETY